MSPYAIDRARSVKPPNPKAFFESMNYKNVSINERERFRADAFSPRSVIKSTRLESN